MSRTRVVQNNFTSGELDPALHERYDFVRYPNGCKLLQNCLLKPQGGASDRWGSHYVAESKNTTATRLVPFVFSTTQAYVLEFGNLYVRFFGSNGQIVSGGSPVEVTTPYTTADLPDLHFTQDSDILTITHPSHQQRELVRLSSTSWKLRTIRAAPPPTVENGLQPNATLTLGALTGTGVSASASSSVFLETDVDRLISEDPTLGAGVAIVVSVTDGSNATVDIVDDFTNLSLLTMEWTLQGSPVARLKPDKSIPVGASVNLTLQRIQEDADDLISNGTFAAGTASWDDYSGPTVSTGTTTAGGGDTDLVDSGATFQTDGVQANYRALNDTDSTEDTVVSVDTETDLTTTSGGASFADIGDTYTIRQTGSVAVSGGKLQLNGGANGVAWIEQDVTVEDGVTYRLTFDVSTQPLSLQIGSSSKASDIEAEARYDLGSQAMTFTADGTTAYIQFRNNQNNSAELDNVEVKKFDIEGWRTGDVGKYVRVNTGIVEITSLTNDATVKGVIRKSLDTDDAALPGSWSLEESKWSDTNGWPDTTTFFGGRRYYFASDTYPEWAWGSRKNIFNDFGTGTDDSDAIEFQIAATQVNRVEWAVGERVLLAGNQREEYTMRGAVGNTLTPSSIEVSSPTSIGSAGIQPERTERSVLFVQRGTRRVRELVYNIEADDRIANDLSIVAEHLTDAGIRSIAFQQEPLPILWVVTTQDELVSLTYLRDHDIVGWAQHPTSGLVKDVAVIPNPDGDRDQVWILVDRQVQNNPPYVEYLDDENGYYGHFTMDSALEQTYDPATTTVSNLDHLEGKTVHILGDGSYLGSATVVHGEVTLSVASSAVEVGLQRTPKLTTLRPTVNGVPLTGLKLSSAKAFVSLLDTLNLLVNGERLTMSSGDDVTDAPPPLFTGMKEVTTLGWDYDAEITLEQDLPYPMHIRGIFRVLEVEDG